GDQDAEPSRNPMGRTGVQGLGFLPQLGPNACTLYVITRISETGESLDVLLNTEAAEFSKNDNPAWDLPGARERVTGALEGTYAPS
ncbi:hypothetical protein CYMTET_33512, partial [Cymbomonas tetramitiformis]